MITINYCRNARFKRQFKKLIRKFRTLEDDIKIVQKAAIELWHIHNKDNNAIELIPGFDNKKIQIYKIKKFACKSLKGKGVQSGIRLIYAFYPDKLEVEFLEIYYKEKYGTDMDKDFIKSFYKSNQ